MKYALHNSQYPIETAEQVKIAEKYFTTNLQHFSPSDRVEIAYNIEKTAEDLGIEITAPWITNYARMMKKTASYSPEFEKNMETRRDFCNVYKVEVKVGNNIIKAAELIDKLVKEKEISEPLQMVTAINELDKMAHLEQHYDQRIMDPIFTVYGSNHNPDYDMEKIAECSVKQLKKAAKNPGFMKKISSLMGESFAKDFQNSPADIFRSMPVPEQQLIAENMNGLD